ncbi:MAG: tRNA pseudouridine(38-40) synthase TruA [Gemmatimonadota bacterium]
MPEHPDLRFRATVHYDGAAFHGWQSQSNGRTVQDRLEGALEGLLGHRPRVRAAGRTDAGVHAAGQEIAFDAPARWEAGELRRALNAVTPEEIWIEKLRRAEADFHPRFDARARRYEYLIAIGEEAESPVRAGRAWPLTREVAEGTLTSVTRMLVGEHSFQAFAKAGKPKRGTRCRVTEARWMRTAAGDLVFRVVADRFLHRMVRYLVSTLVEAGTGRRAPGEVDRLLAGEPGVRPPTPAPACGLYLTGVRYADGWNRPAGIPGVRIPDRTERCAGRTGSWEEASKSAGEGGRAG